MTFQSTFIPCNTYIITTNFQWPSEHKHLANIRWSLDFSGHENSRQKSALNSWQACGGLRVAEGSNRYTKDSWISCHIWRDLCSVIICSCWPSIQSLNWDPAWGRRGMRGGRRVDMNVHSKVKRCPRAHWVSQNGCCTKGSRGSNGLVSASICSGR